MRKKHKQTLLWVFLGLVGLAMLAAIIAILLPDRYVSDELMGTITIVGLYSLGGMIIVAISREMRWTTRIAFTSMAISMFVFIFLIWFERHLRGDTEEHFFKLGSIALVTGFLFTHRLLIAPIRMHVSWGIVCKRAALISSAVSASIIIFGVLNEGFFSWDDAVVRLLGVGLVFAAGASIGTGAIAIFGPKPGDDEPGLLDESIDVTLTCPRCAKSLSLRSNRDQRCDGCRLKLHVRVEEPRCACGYLLYQLDADTCPECGRTINPDDRWSPSPA